MRLNLVLELLDVPGQLVSVLEPISGLGANLVTVIHKREDGQLIGLLPITPRILMAKGKCNDRSDLFYITHITDAAVGQYNKAIWNNAEEFVIHPNCT